MERANVELAGRVLDAVRAQPHRVRLVHIGTVHEYGAGVRGAGTAESDPAEPVSAYGETKLRGTMAVLRAARADGLDAVVLRVANVCGPGAPEGSFPRVLVDSVRRALAEGGVTPLRFGSLSAWRDYVDVRDVADAVLAAALAPRDAVAAQIINIGSGAAVRTRQLVDRMLALSGLRAPVVEAARSHAVRSDVDWLQLDISKARAVLGWQPRRGLDQSLRDLLGAGERTRT
jgi:nucleoside-diphosphate-sugar epimerase